MQAVTLEAIQTLRIYFVDALHCDVTRIDASKDDPASKLLEFVRVKFEQYTATLLARFRSPAPRRTQLAAVMAVMEAVRSGSFPSACYCSSCCSPWVVLRRTAIGSHKRGRCAEQVGTFNSDLYGRLLAGVLTGKHVKSAAVAALLATCTPHADCLFFLAKWIASTADELSKSEQAETEVRHSVS